MISPAALHFQTPIAMKHHLLPRLLFKLIAGAFFLAISTGAALAAQEIVVENLPAATNIVDNVTVVNLGSVEVGSPPSGTINKNFRIRNTGDANLTLNTVTITGVDAGQFSVTTQPTSPVAPGGFTDFTVRFAPTSRGTKNATVSIGNNDSDENPFGIILTADAIAPEISVDQGPNNDVTAVDFGTVNLGTNPNGSTTRTFTIHNSGDANLTVSLTGLNGTDFSVTTAPAGSIGQPNGSTNFTIRFAPTTRGAKSATLQINNNDPDGNENPYSISLTGTATAPVITVEQPALVNFPNNGTANYNTVPVGFASDLTFTIRNTGDASLSLTSFTFGGIDARFFDLVGATPTTVGAGLSTTFTVRFGPSDVRAHTGSLAIANNSATSPFTINLAGTGITNPTSEDAFGYKCTAIAGGNIMDFLNASDPGVVTEGTLTGIDKAVPLDIGFNFFFYEKAYSRCSISTTGLITFGGSSIDYTPDPIPGSFAPDNFIAPLWTDIQITTSSRILYKTVGVAPDRIFVVKYENVKLYHNGAATTDKRVTFQVQLYETSNTIQVRYQDNTPFIDFPPQQLTVGIESRNYGTEDPQPGVGIVGIQYKNGQFASNKPWINDGSSILFTRPVVITVESKYAKPTPTVLDPTATTPTNVGTPALGLNPGIGTIYKTAINTVKRFEAPEFIYLNRNFEELPEAGDVNAPPDSRAWYRLVNDGYALDGQVVQGTQLFFTTTLEHDVTVVWRWRLECAVFVDAPAGQQGSFGAATPEVGRHWYRLGQQLNASIDTNIVNLEGGFRYHTVGYTLFDKNGTLPGTSTSFAEDNAARRGITPLSITAPIRLTWNLIGQVRYRFDAFSSTTPGSTFNGHSFIRVYSADRVTGDATFGAGGIVYGNVPNQDVWIETGRKVDFGAFYRTSDGMLTLSGFGGSLTGDLVSVTSVNDHMDDELNFPAPGGGSRVARVFTVRSATAPTEAHWNYQTTVFRAEIPFGESLEVDPTGTVATGRLAPNLPASARLKVTDSGPGTVFTTKRGPADSSTIKSGDPLRWDTLGKALFPVHPGVYEVSWPDGNDATTTYRVEVLTGYPGETVNRLLGSEDSNGARILEGQVLLTGCGTTDGSATVTCPNTTGLQVNMNVRGKNIATGTKIVTIVPNTSFTLSSPATGTSAALALTAWRNYQTAITLPEIDVNAGFPGQAENAHYRHLFDSDASKRAPTKLDLSTTDEWKFQELAFADASTGANANKTAPGVPFTATGSGRSILLYSYRPNPDEVADGTLSQEKLAVRVVRSSPVTVISRDNAKLVLGRRGLELGGGAPSAGGSFGIVGSAGSVVPGNQFVLDFWLNAKGLESSSAVTLTNCTTNGTTAVTCASTAGVSAGMSISGPTIPAGAKIASVNSGTSITLSVPATTGGVSLSLSASYSAVTLTNCVTTGGTTTVTCSSTADVVPGMSISGTNIVPGTKIASKTNATTLVLTTAATGNGSGLTLTTSNKPVTVLSSGSGGLKVTLDSAASTVTATYRGIPVTHALSKAGAAWRHYVIHVFTQEVFGTGVTVVDFYLDGVRAEQALPTGFLQGSADSTIAATLGANSFRFGVDADPQSGLQIDQFRLFSFSNGDQEYLSPGEVLQLKSTRDMTIAPTTVASITTPTQFVLSKPATGTGSGLTLSVGGVTLTNCSTSNGSTTVNCDSTATLLAGQVVKGTNIVAGTLLRNSLPRLWFSFEATPSTGSFANQGTSTGVGVGPVTGASPYAGTWANVGIQEVATRIDCTLDNAGFGGSGYVRNPISNFNAELYSRAAEIGEWGPIFPVNDKQLFVDNAKKLEVVYYENPYLVDRVPHPNVAWPYVATEYNDVSFPVVGPHKSKAIYIASRIGSEGVDQVGRPQKVYDLARYSGLKIYNQPNNTLAGYNPNEEHALTAPSGRAAVKVKNLGEAANNNPPLAAFALQTNINNKPSYTSDAWVLVQVNNLDTGEPEMAAYRVFSTRTGTIPFPRPADSQVNGSTGLTYEAAATPEARFLTLNPGTAFNFAYQFEYPVFAGDLLVPPYPLNLVIGNVSMADERGGNIQVNNVNQRTLWRDASLHAWIVSGNGKFFEQFFYPMRSDFYLPGAGVGASVAWLPPSATTTAGFIGDNRPGSPNLDDEPKPVKVRYSSAWRSDYPKLKRGETLTYQGGEYFNETPGSNGLPAVVAMKAVEVVYDSATPTMVIGEATTTELNKASARVIRPLDRREYRFTNAQMKAAGLIPGDPASSKVIVVAERWYFKELTGSLQKRFYFDSLAENLVFRGRLNDKEGGDPNLTAGPDPINALEPDVLTLDEYKKTAPEKGLYDLATTGDWTTAINSIFAKSQNPNGATSPATSTTAPVFLQGVKPVPATSSLTDKQKALLNEQKTFWRDDLTGTVTSPDPVLVQLDSFGVGSALVPNANLLTTNPTGSLYITLAENNREELNGAPVSLHIVEIVPDRYRGAIKVIEGSDAFSEKITLQHNGEFGANTGDLNYEWWIRDSRELDDTLKSEIDSLSTALPNPNWQLYKAGPALHTIVFEGRPDVVLADKLVLMRYRHKNETAGWRVIPFELPTGTTPAVAWQPGSSSLTAPFQWAGAANSPQLQADGSKRYIPQLVMGWVKRVLDRINPYEARYTDFFSNESPAGYSSMIQIAGGPYAGNVALNPDKNVIERTGLIELYRTVLNRAISLSIGNSSNGNATDGINQALLLAATRLTVFYELLAREAYSDAQDTTISVNDDDTDGLASVASFTHAFQNLEPDLLHEELSLLRGSDFRKSYPVYNRMFWNYTKGLGEAAYNSNYNIYDANKDGFINEDDARLLYPQGHGDSWGHFLSAAQMHYMLLQHPNFSWKARAELYSLMQNVLPADYLDEKTFARLAAGKARAGRDIVRATYRLGYTHDPDGQWQGYTDEADKARAWGVSEWAHRAGQAAYFDWAVANAILPAQAVDANGKPLQNLSEIERSGAVDEIGGIAAGFYEIQTALDDANTGANPLGFSSDAIAFDIDPTLLYVGSTAQVGTRAIQGLTHFEQILERAIIAGRNANNLLQVATAAENKLRVISNNTEELLVDSLRQDLDYRNRLIEIFGRPYSGQIGFGKTYPEGYEGPDTLLYAYLDKVTIDKIVPQVPNAGEQVPANLVTFNTIYRTVKGYGMYSSTDNPTITELYKDAFGDDGDDTLTDAFETIVGNNLYQLENTTLTLPYNTASKYGFEAPADWGQRTSYGRAQTALGEMLAAEINLEMSIADYLGYLQDWEQKLHNLQSEVEIYKETESVKDAITGVRAGFTSAFVAAKIVINVLAAVTKSVDAVEDTAIEWVDNPLFVGTSVSVPAAPAKGAVATAAEPVKLISDTTKDAAEAALEVLNLVRDEVIAALERDKDRLDAVRQIQGLVAELEYHSGGDQPKRDAIGAAAQELELKRQEYFTAVSEGFRVLREREVFNKVLAAKSQKNRYQDMIIRLTRNEAMAKYQSAFNLAARYTWLAAKAYDYETSLDPGDPAAATTVFDQIVKERQLGFWPDGNPNIGKGGLGEILGLLKSNFEALEGRIGLNNVQIANEGLSLRAENFRIGPPLDPEVQAALDTPVANRTPEQVALITDNQEAINEAAASEQRWRDVLKGSIVDDLRQVPEYRQHCRPIADPAAGKQPGLVIRFSSVISPGQNFFGRPLVAGDHAYSTSQFSTRIAVAGILLDGYQSSGAQGLAATPRAYLVPVGTDYCLVSTSDYPKTRSWTVKDVRVPIPYVINQSQMSSLEFIPRLDGIDGTYGEVRRHADFRMFHGADLDGDGNLGVDDDNNSTRLMARSIWNSEWVLIIPGAGLYYDATEGVKRFTETVSDITLNFKTYSHNGQ